MCVWISDIKVLSYNVFNVIIGTKLALGYTEYQLVWQHCAEAKLGGIISSFCYGWGVYEFQDLDKWGYG